MNTKLTWFLCAAVAPLVMATAAQAQTIDYPPGSNNAAPIVLTSSTDLRVVSGTATQSGVISQDASTRGVSKIGAGELVFTANNTYTGFTSVTQGTLSLGAGGPSGSVAGSISVNSNGTLLFNRSDNVTLNNAVIGAGLTRNIGAGVLTITPAFQARLENQGTVRLTGGTFASANPIANAGTLIIDMADNSSLQTQITGAGAIRKQGTGTVTSFFSGSSTGPVLVEAGTLRWIPDVSGPSINVASGAAFVFANNDTNGFLFFNGALSGAGTVRKEGVSTVALGGSSSLTSAINVTGGQLRVTGAYGATPVILAPNTMLSGTGAVGAVTVNGGVISPGGAGVLDTSATLTVNGALTFDQNSRLLVSLDGVGDRLNVSGNVTLDGALILSGTLIGAQRLLIIDGGGTVSGAFDTVSGSALNGLSPAVSVEGNDVFVVYELSLVGNTALTANGLRFLQGLNRYFVDTGFLDPIYIGLTAPVANAVPGEIVPAAYTALGASFGRLLEATADESADSMVRDDASATPWRLWSNLAFRSTSLDGDATRGISAVDVSSTETVLGADRRVGEGTLIGLSIGAFANDVEGVAAVGDGSADSIGFNLYGRTEFGPFYAFGALGYTRDEIATRRTVTAPARQVGDGDADTFGGYLEAGVRIGGSSASAMGYVAAETSRTNVSPYTEGVTEPVSGRYLLTYLDQTLERTRYEAGGRFRMALDAGGTPIALKAKLAYSSDEGVAIDAGVANLPGSRFRVESADPGDAVLLSLGIDVQPAPQFTVTGYIGGEFGDSRDSGYGGVTLGYRW